MATIAELTVSLTYAEAKALLYAAIEANGVDVASWKDGAPIRAVVAGAAVMLSGFSALTTTLFESGFLSSADSGYLEVLAQDVYETTVQDAQAGTGKMTLDNSLGGGSFNLAPGEMTVRDPATGKTFNNAVTVVLAPAATLTLQDFVAVEAGADSNAAIGDVIEIVSPTMPAVTVINTTAFLGLDAEGPEPLRTRARAKLGALSPNGPSDAYDHIAKASVRESDGSLIGVTRTRGFPNNATGEIAFFVGSATAGIPGTVGDTGTDLGKVDDDCQRLATPLCVSLSTETAVVFSQSVVVEVWMWDDLDLTDAALQSGAEDNLENVLQVQTPIGGTVVGADPGKIFRDTLIGAVQDASFGKIFQLDMTTPAADVTLGNNDLPVFGTLTLTINRVPRQ